MKPSLYQHIFEKQQEIEAVPPNEEITGWASRLICLLYPELSKCSFRSVEQIEKEFNQLKKDLIRILHGTNACDHCDNEAIAESFFEAIPELYQILNTDIDAILNGDPAAKSEFEVIRAYPGFYAISFYRIAHGLLKRNVPLLPRILTEYAHSKTGIDIHPGAEIGAYFHIDHGTGIVIGETTIIGRNVRRSEC
jgi:serine O-acetyltransferase